MDAGHFVSRRWKATKFDERNVWPQCPKCNRFSGGEAFLMANYIDTHLGHGTADLLHNLSRVKCKLDRLWYEEQIKIYRAKLRALT
jgi:hypothetical protein